MKTIFLYLAVLVAGCGSGSEHHLSSSGSYYSSYEGPNTYYSLYGRNQQSWAAVVPDEFQEQEFESELYDRCNKPLPHESGYIGCAFLSDKGFEFINEEIGNLSNEMQESYVSSFEDQISHATEFLEDLKSGGQDCKPAGSAVCEEFSDKLSDLEQELIDKRSKLEQSLASQSKEVSEWKSQLDSLNGSVSRSLEQVPLAVKGIEGVTFNPSAESPVDSHIGRENFSIDPDSFEGQLLENYDERYERAEGLLADYSGADSRQRNALLGISKFHRDIAQLDFERGDYIEGMGNISAATRALDLATDFVPGVSIVKDLYSIWTGSNMVTGEKLSDVEIALTSATLLMPAVVAGATKSLTKLGAKLGRLMKKGGESGEFAGKLRESIRKSDLALAPKGKMPCSFSLNERGIERFLRFLWPVAYAENCVPIGAISDEVVDSARKFGATDAAGAKSYANLLDRIGNHSPKDIIQYEKLKAALAVEEIKGAKVIGSAMKSDPAHRSASFMLDIAAKEGKVTSLRGGDGVVRNLLQVEGSLNGNKGIFEWIVGPEGLTHQRFIKDGIMTGFPNQIPKNLP